MGYYKPSKKILAAVLKEFYRTELKPGEAVIDNRDKTIAKIVGISLSEVQCIIASNLLDKFYHLNKKINKKTEILL